MAVNWLSLVEDEVALSRSLPSRITVPDPDRYDEAGYLALNHHPSAVAHPGPAFNSAGAWPPERAAPGGYRRVAAAPVRYTGAVEAGAETTFAEAMSVVAQVFEATAAAVILLGLLWAAWLSWRTYRASRSGEAAYKTVRRAFGGAILLGLEILVAGDLIRTVAVEPTLENAVTLGIIVLIRTLLSFSLQVEMEGVLPWRRTLVSGATIARRAHQEAVRPDDDGGPG